MPVIRRKLTIVGDHACGKKNSLMIAFSMGTSLDEPGYARTIFEDYVADMDVDGGLIELVFWDSDSPDSLSDVQDKVTHFYPVILVDCKKDLECNQGVIEEFRKLNKWPVTPKEGMGAAQKIDAGHYLECSAKSGEGIREVFHCAARAALVRSNGRTNFPFVRRALLYC